MEHYLWIILYSSIVVAFSIAIAICFILEKNHDKKFRNSLENKFTNNIIYVVNFEDQTVKYFNFHDLKTVKIIPYTDFLGKLAEKERNRVSNWIIDLIFGKELLTDDNKICVSDVISGKVRNRVFHHRILFVANVVDREKKIVYLNSNILNNLPSEYNSSKRGIAKKDVYKDSEANRYYSHGMFLKGNMYVINIYRNQNTMAQFNEYGYCYFIANAIMKKRYLSSFYMVFTENDPLEIIVLDTRQLNEFQIRRILKQFTIDIKENLEVHGYSSFYTFSVVGAKTQDLDNNYLNAYQKMQNIAKLCKDSDKEFMFFKNEANNSVDPEESYKAEVQKLLKFNSINAEFMPIVKIANKRVLTQGYISYVSPKNSIFDTIDEAKKYAQKYELDKELFSMIARKVIPIFNNEKESQALKIFYPIKLNEIPYIIRSFSHLNGAGGTKYVLIIDNDDLVDNETNVALMTSIKNLQQKDYEVYLSIKVGDYNLRNATYSLFDGFIFDAKLSQATRIESREFMNSRNLLEKLFQFKVPIVSINTNSWSEIELLVKSGVNSFISKEIADKSSMVVPLDKRPIKKLLNMKQK